MTGLRVKNIAIIGAGPAGLASAKYLCHQGAFDRIVIFEQQAEVGGVWNYSPEPPAAPVIPQTSPFCPLDQPLYLRREDSGQDSPIPVFSSPMYENLNTNIPHTLMSFSDLDFPFDSVIFPSRQVVHKYIIEYSQPLRHLIRFSTQVTKVKLQQNRDGSDKWEVHSRQLTQNMNSNAPALEVFDGVVVASGHYAVPYIPSIPGITQFHNKFPGIIAHSKTYRKAQPFAGKRTVVVGNAASGLDIAKQIHTVCKQPLLVSAQTPTPIAQLDYCGAEEVPEIEEFLSHERPCVRFKGGRIAEVDAVLFCTGYLFSFPFLSNDTLGEPPLVRTGRRVQGLYRHLFHIRYPTLVFPGLLIKAVPFPICEGQAAVFARAWSNNLDLPSVSRMVKWEELELKRRGEAMHVMPSEGDIDYINEMHEWAMKSQSNGKEPPKWEGEMVWQRLIYKAAKLAFEKSGKKATSLAELGFLYSPEVPLQREHKI